MLNFSPVELQQHLENNANNTLILDVREAWEYQQCHLPDSELVPMRQIPAAVAQMDAERETVVVCHHGIRSRQVAMFLERSGFKNIINLSGGMAGWARDVDPSMPTY